MTHEENIEYCLAKTGAYLDYPFDPIFPVVKVKAASQTKGRIFAQPFILRGEPKVTLSCTPMSAEFYRSVYPGSVVGGWHCLPIQQPHFNTVSLDGSVSDDGSPLAPYTLLSVTEDGFTVEERRVEYDVENAISAARKTAIYKNGSDFMEACLFGIHSGYDYISELRETAQRLSEEQSKPVPKGQAVDNDIWRLAVREVFDAHGIKTKKDIRLVVTDLDGTLLRSDKTISAYTADVFRRLQSNGIRIIAATARPIRAVYEFIDITKHISFDRLIFHNGAVTEVDGQILSRESIPSAMTKALAGRLVSELDAKVAVEIDDKQYANYDPSEYWPGIVVTQVDDFNQLPEMGADKMIVWTKSTEDWLRMESMLPDDLYVLKDEGRSTGLIMYKNATKWNAIRLLAEKWNVTLSEIAAFGDDYNDIEMLQNSGVGVAVANALDEVKAVADYICGSNDEDVNATSGGVAKWLEENVL